MSAPVREGTSLRRSLSVWQAVGLSVALMAPSMAANINPQGTALTVGRATPLAFLLAAIAVLLIAYVFVRLCQYYRHAGSVYVFVGATLGAPAGAIAGLCLIGTYVFYALVTASAAGIFGSQFLDIIGVWNNQPSWAGFLVGFVALAAGAAPRGGPGQAGRRGAAQRRGHHGRADRRGRPWWCWSGCWPATHPHGATFTMKVFEVAARHELVDAVPRHRLRSAVLRRASRPPRRSARRPTTRSATSRARSSAPRSSAASTSPWSPRSR